MPRQGIAPAPRRITASTYLPHGRGRRRLQASFRRVPVAPSGDWASGNPAFAISRGSPGAPPRTPGHGRRFPGMLFSPLTFRITGQPSDPRTPPPVPARYAGDTAVRLVAHAGSGPAALSIRRPGAWSRRGCAHDGCRFRSRRRFVDAAQGNGAVDVEEIARQHDRGLSTRGAFYSGGVIRPPGSSSFQIPPGRCPGAAAAPAKGAARRPGAPAADTGPDPCRG